MNYPQKTTTRGIDVCRVILAGMCTVLSARAQQPQPSQSPPATPGNETIALSVFEVRVDKDVGYVANDTLAGGRLSIKLLQDPNDVTVLTREFLDDIGAWDTNQAAVWLPGATVTESSDGRDFGGNVSFRSLPSSGVTRDYYAYPISVDEFVIDRFEGARGPNAIVYSDAAAGGRPNVTTKRAQFHSFQSVALRFDTRGSIRATADINRRLNEKLALRLNVLAQDRQSWLDRFFDRRTGAQGAATYKPWRGAEIRFEGEYVESKTSAVGYVWGDTASLWDRTTTTSGPLSANPAAATGLSRFTTDTLVMSPSLPGVVNFINLARTNGTGLSIPDGGEGERPFANFPVLPSRSFRITPDEYFQSVRTNYFSGTFQQSLPWDLHFEGGMSFANVVRWSSGLSGNNVNVDVNRLLPGGAPNPNFGKTYSTSGYASSVTPNYNHSSRATLARAFNLPWLREILSVNGQRRVEHFKPRGWSIARIKDPNNPNISPVLTNASNAVTFWRYWDDPGAPFTKPVNRDGYEFLEYLNRDTFRNTRLDSLQVSSISHLFEGKATIVGGFRWDDYTVSSRTGLFNANGYRAGERYTTIKAKAFSRAVGATYFPIRQIGLYVNYSEGFSPQGDENAWVSTPKFTTESVNRAGGLRFNIGERLLVGSIGYYKTTEADRMQNVTNARNQINQLWTDVNMAERQIPGPFSIINDTLDYTGTGWEADLVVNPTRSIRLRFNLTFPETSQINSVKNLRAYFEENLPVWQAGINDPANPNSTRITTDIANLANNISGFTDGRTLNGTFKWRANVFGQYEFLTGMLKNFRVGGGANVYGRRLIGNPAGQPFNFIYAEEYFVATATAGYRFKVRNHNVDIALNVNNLFDYDRPVFSGVSIFRGLPYRGGFTYVDPRSVTVTATLKL